VGGSHTFKPDGVVGSAGVSSPTPTVAKVLGRDAERFRVGQPKEAEDVADLLGEGPAGLGDGGPAAVSPPAPPSGPWQAGAVHRRVSTDDDTVLEDAIRRRTAQAETRVAIARASHLDYRASGSGAPAGPSAAASDLSAFTAGGSAVDVTEHQSVGPLSDVRPGRRSEVRRGAALAGGRDDMASSHRKGRRLSTTTGAAGPPAAGGSAAASSFVTALRSELGHTTTLSRRTVSRKPGTPTQGGGGTKQGGLGHAARASADLAAAGSVANAIDATAVSVAGPSTVFHGSDEDEELDELLSSGPDPSSLESHASHVWSSDTDVELFVRALLARPTQRRLMYARALLDEALLVFPESVFVRLTFTTYLFSRSATFPDIFLAMRLLAEATTMPASLDLRFAVFSKLNSAVNARRRLVLGDGQPGMRHDSLDLVEFKKGVKRAGDKHREAVTLLLSYWTSLAHGGCDGITMRGGTVSNAIAGIIRASDEAEKSYLTVLERWPTSQQVQRAYGIFLINVRNEKDTGEAYLGMGENADDDGAGQASGSVSGKSKSHRGRSGGSVGMRSSRSGASLTSVENIKRRKKNIGSNGDRMAGSLRDISRMRNGFRLGLLALLAVIVGMFVLASALFRDIRLTVSVMNSASERRSFIFNAVYNARGQRIAARENATAAYREFQSGTMTAAANLHSATTKLYFRGPQPEEVSAQWRTPTIPVSFWNPDPPPGVSRSDRMGLLDASNLFVANTVNVGRLNLTEMQAPWNAQTTSPGAVVSDGDPFYSSPAYRFVLTNAAEMVKQLELATQLYQRGNFRTARATDGVMSGLSAVRFLVLLALGWCVLVPAIMAVRTQKLALRSLILAIPRGVASAMAARLKAVNAAMAEAHSSATPLEEVDPTSRLYATLRDSRFLVTLPRSKEKRAGAKGGTGLTGAAAGANLPEAPMLAIAEESDVDDTPRAIGGSRSLTVSLPGKAGSVGAIEGGRRPAAFERVPWSGRRRGGGSDTDRHPAAVSGQRRGKGGRGGAAGGSSALAAPSDVSAGAGPGSLGTKGGDRESSLVHERDLLESVTDADELAALMARRRDARTVREHASSEGDHGSRPGCRSLGVRHTASPNPTGAAPGPSDGSTARPASPTALAPGSHESGPSSGIDRAPSGGGLAALPDDAEQSAAGGRPLALREPVSTLALVPMAAPAEAGQAVPLRDAWADGKEAAGGAPLAVVTGAGRAADPQPAGASPAAHAHASPCCGGRCCAGGCCARCSREPERRGPPRTAADEENDDEISRKLGVCSNASLRSIVVRASLVISVLVALMVTSTAVMYTTAAVTDSRAAQVNNAGRTRMLTKQTVGGLRDLILADGQMGSVDKLTASVGAAIDRYQRIHNGLRLGDPSLGLPERRPGVGESQQLVDLYYGSADRGFPVDGSGSADYSDFDEVGLDPLVRHFLETARRVLRTYGNASAARPPRTLSGLLSVPQFRALWEMERGTLVQKLGFAVDFYVSADRDAVNALEVQAYIVLSVEVVILAAAYLLVYEGISSALISEHLRSKDVHDLIPPLVRRGVPELVQAFEKPEVAEITGARRK